MARIMLHCVGDDARKSLRIDSALTPHFISHRQCLWNFMWTRCRQFFPSQGQEGKGGDTLWARGIVPTLLIAIPTQISKWCMKQAKNEETEVRRITRGCPILKSRSLRF
jgi:hypothetical protein